MSVPTDGKKATDPTEEDGDYGTDSEFILHVARGDLGIGDYGAPAWYRKYQAKKWELDDEW